MSVRSRPRGIKLSWLPCARGFCCSKCQRTALFLPLLLLSFAVTAQADDAKTLQTIRTAVRENFSSINSLECEWYYQDTVANRDFVTWEWAFQGEKFLLLHELGHDIGNPEGIESREWISFNGAKGYYIDYDPDDLSKVRSILRSSWPPQQYRNSATPLRLLGWQVIGTDETFLALLDKARLLGKEEIEGHDCWKIEATTQKNNRLTAWIDPAVGYWHRRLAITFRDYVSDNIATEFGQFDDLALGGKRWFPIRFRHRRGGKAETVLANIRINPTISDTRFTPDIPDGTYITDEPATPNQVSSYSGRGNAGFEAYKKNVAEEAARLRAMGGPMADASCEGWWTWPTVLFLASAIVLIVGGGIWFRAWRRG